MMDTDRRIGRNEARRMTAPLNVEIVGANIDKVEDGTVLRLYAEGDGGPLTMSIPFESSNTDKAERGYAAIHYLIGELGLHDVKDHEDLIFRKLARWAWDRVESIANPPQRPAPVVRHPAAPAPKKEEAKGRFVYVISCNGSDKPLCKIGIANSPEARLRQLSTGSPFALTLELARRTDKARRIEANAHRHFAAQRRNGEWFEMLADEAIAFVISATRKAA